MATKGRAGGAKTGGRVAGTPNKATADIKALAQVYGSAAIGRLAEMSGLTSKAGAKNEQTRLAAIRELLDRGYGKPAQGVTIAGPAVIQITTGVPREPDAGTDGGS